MMHLSHIFTLIRRVRTRDTTIFLPRAPDGWLMAIGTYAACQGAYWMLSPDLFSRLPSYAFLAVQPLPQALWGSVLLTYATASLACLLFSKKAKRAALGVVGTVIWLYLGTEMLAASVAGGFLYPTGMFEILAGAGCAVATMQLAHAP